MKIFSISIAMSLLEPLKVGLHISTMYNKPSCVICKQTYGNPSKAQKFTTFWPDVSAKNDEKKILLSSLLCNQWSCWKMDYTQFENMQIQPFGLIGLCLLAGNTWRALMKNSFLNWFWISYEHFTQESWQTFWYFLFVSINSKAHCDL